MKDVAVWLKIWPIYWTLHYLHVFIKKVLRKWCIFDKIWALFCWKKRKYPRSKMKYPKAWGPWSWQRSLFHEERCDQYQKLKAKTLFHETKVLEFQMTIVGYELKTFENVHCNAIKEYILNSVMHPLFNSHLRMYSRNPWISIGLDNHRFIFAPSTFEYLSVWVFALPSVKFLIMQFFMILHKSAHVFIGYSLIIEYRKSFVLTNWNEVLPSVFSIEAPFVPLSFDRHLSVQAQQALKTSIQNC